MASKLIVDLLSEKGIRNVADIQFKERNARRGEVSDNECAVVKFKDPRDDLQLFLKICQKGSLVANIFNPVLNAFKKEEAFYEDILLCLANFQAESVSEGTLSIPIDSLFLRYFGSGMVDGDIYVVLEKICDQHHYLVQQDEFLTHEEIQCSLKSIAKFHAVSYCMQIMKKINFLEGFPILEDRMFHPRNRQRFAVPFFAVGYKENLRVIKTLHEEAKNGNPRVTKHQLPWDRLSDTAIKRLENLSEKMLDVLHHICISPGASGVVCHGDYHQGNIAFNKGDTSYPKLFDFQLVRYSTALLDITYLLFLGTTSFDRQQNLTDYLKTYCDAFKLCCDELGLDHELNIFTLDFILEEYKRTSPWGFLQAVLLCIFRITGYMSDNILLPNTSDEIIDLFERVDKSWFALEVLIDLIQAGESEGVIDVIEKLVSEISDSDI